MGFQSFSKTQPWVFENPRVACELMFIFPARISLPTICDNYKYNYFYDFRLNINTDSIPNFIMAYIFKR
eukprot:UN09707